MRLNSRLVAAVALAATAATIGVAVGATQPWGAPSTLDRQAASFTAAAVTVHDQSWHTAMPFERICPRGLVSVDASLAFIGAIQYKVIIDDGPTALPGTVTASTTTASPTTSNFTFLFNAQPFEANDHHYVQLWWRALNPSGATLRAATLIAQYHEGSLRC